VIRLVGLYREKEYSPGRHQSNDTLLLDAVTARVRTRHCQVDVGTIDRRPDATLIFSMCQGRAALERLLAWERAGAQIVNSPRAALNTYRDRLAHVMAHAGVPFPETQLVATSRDAESVALQVADVARPFQGRGTRRDSAGFWLKRGDVHASVSADVQWISSPEALEAGCADFRSRGIAVAAVQSHRPGDEIKFYGVAGGAFFHWFYSGPSRGYAFDPAVLPRLAARAAQAAGLEVFGGDVIVSASGELTLIDLNDWPSFAPCREAAADAIADYLARRAHAAWNSGLVSSANQSAV
jgi:hypothetical protein